MWWSFQYHISMDQTIRNSTYIIRKNSWYKQTNIFALNSLGNGFDAFYSISLSEREDTFCRRYVMNASFIQIILQLDDLILVSKNVFCMLLLVHFLLFVRQQLPFFRSLVHYWVLVQWKYSSNQLRVGKWGVLLVFVEYRFCIKVVGTTNILRLLNSFMKKKMLIRLRLILIHHWRQIGMIERKMIILVCFILIDRLGLSSDWWKEGVIYNRIGW